MKKFLTSLALAVTTAASAAAPVPLGVLNPSASFSHTVSGEFSDTYTFSLDKASLVASSITNVAITFNGITFGDIDHFAAELNGVDLAFTPTTTPGAFTITTQVLSGGVTLPIGAYVLTVSGVAKTPNASYGGNIVATPVPEPSSYLLLAAGLVGIAVTRRRR